MQQLMGSADDLDEVQQGDSVPTLHRAVLQGDDDDSVAKVRKELQDCHCSMW
jgi:hypothetical protein